MCCGRDLVPWLQRGAAGAEEVAAWTIHKQAGVLGRVAVPQPNGMACVAAKP